jgi:hypothetical protein
MGDKEPFCGELRDTNTEVQRQDLLAMQDRDRRNALWATAAAAGATLLLAPLAAVAGSSFLILSLALALGAVAALCLVLR